jgi:hypothetical protein
MRVITGGYNSFETSGSRAGPKVASAIHGEKLKEHCWCSTAPRNFSRRAHVQHLP